MHIWQTLSDIYYYTTTTTILQISGFPEVRDSEWQWNQLGHASTPQLRFLQAKCPFSHSTNSVKALKAHLSNTSLMPLVAKILPQMYRCLYDIIINTNITAFTVYQGYHL